MIDRDILKGNITLIEKVGDDKSQKTFTIKKHIAYGGSAMCYKAKCQDGMGILKEFYPKEIETIYRKKDKNLYIEENCEQDINAFNKLKQEYVGMHEMLIEMMDKKGNDDFYTFFPHFKIFYSDKSDDSLETVYVWTPETKLETFETFCERIHNNPKKDSTYNLACIIDSIYNLTVSIEALHRAGLIHRDINPSNFGFQKRKEKLLAQTVSIFDINTICSVENPPSKTYYTQGFSEPEIGNEEPDNRTDIYSIGATLFYAVVINDEMRENGFKYDSDMYNRIEELVNSSELITACEANSHPRVRAGIIKILKKSLCLRPQRYSDCEELEDDLYDIISYILPAEYIAKKKDHPFSDSSEDLKAVKKALSKNSDKNSTLAMQKLLYDYPLYKYVKDEEKIINVSIFGFGDASRKFLDICLQVGQMYDKQLNISVYSKLLSDFDMYLNERPEMKNFFNIDNKNQNAQDLYGNINFKQTEFVTDIDENKNIIQNMMLEKENNFPRYAFVALGDDKANGKCAEAIEEVASVMEEKCLISFTCEEKYKGKRSKDCIPVYVNETNLKNDEAFKDIERMALNAHLVWVNDFNSNFKGIYKEFKEPYNYSSCISNVLSIKYKLYSVGIDIDKFKKEGAAREFYTRINDNSKRAKNSEELRGDRLRNALIYVEHRRWVTEKICLGWRSIDDISECLNGTHNDKKNKRHACIVKSRPDQMLEKKVKCKWHDIDDKTLKELDDLDRLSVNLHKLYYENAQKIKDENSINNYSLNEMEKIAKQDSHTNSAFLEWKLCIDDILNGYEKNIRQYDKLKNNFINVMKKNNPDMLEYIKYYINLFEIKFNIVKKAYEYTDYKKKDTDLVDNIPFILTFSQSNCIIVPYQTEDKKLLRNIEAATVLNPKKIVYLYKIDSVNVDYKMEINKIAETLTGVGTYANKKDIRSDIDFCIITNNNILEKVEKEVSAKFGEVTKEREINVKCIGGNSDKEKIRFVISYLKRLSNYDIVAFQKEDVYLSGSLADKLPEFIKTYEFDEKRNRFIDESNQQSACTPIKYLRKTPHISISDVLSLKGNKTASCSQPEFLFDYDILWNKYKQSRKCWKALCSDLKEYAENEDVICTFKKKYNEHSKEISKIECKVSSRYKTALDKILDVLIEKDFVSSDSCVSFYTSSICKLNINCSKEGENNFNILLSNSLKLCKASNIYLDTFRLNEVNVCFNDLTVKGAKLNAKNDKLFDEETDILTFFNKLGYIINLKIDKEKKEVSFTYGDEQIKDLLTMEGRILEVYVYHSAKKTGFFDDVESSNEVKWKDERIKNEFDCTLTKGFRSIFVECKARRNIEANFYYKIDSLPRALSVNTIPVLVADTGFGANDNQYLRGKGMNVITVYDNDDIDNIGDVLVDIIKGKRTE